MTERFGGAASGSPQMRALFDTLRAIAPGHGGVLLRGERGTGRETLATALHELSRPGQPCIIVDVATIPSLLIESVLFGHEHSTFTGGSVVKRGVLETAESGTIVLCEVAAIPLELQPKLLRVLQRREFRRIGSAVMRPFHGRVVATTHCALEELVPRAFRADLLAAITRDADVAIPPLRERISDLVGALAPLQLDGQLVDRLSRLAWPGNFDQVRAFERALGQRITPADAVTELELLQAIQDAPADDEPRRVYGDLLSRRGDPRGELLQLQCRATDSITAQAMERRLLDTHHKAWTSQVVDLASSPSLPARATLVRGFVHQIACEGDSLRRLDAIFGVAPLVTEVVVEGEVGPNTWISPLLRRLRALEVKVPSLAPSAVADLAACPYLANLTSLRMTGLGVEAREILLGSQVLTGATISDGSEAIR